MTADKLARILLDCQPDKKVVFMRRYGNGYCELLSVYDVSEKGGPQSPDSVICYLKSESGVAGE